MSHTEPASPPVSISLINGAPQGSVDRFANQIYTESKRRGFTTTMRGSAKKAFIMSGHLTAAPAPDGVKVFYVWDVQDPSRRHRHRISGEETIIGGAMISDPWAAVDDSAMQRVASRTAEGLSGFISQMGYEVTMASVPPPAAMLSTQADSIQTASILATPPLAPSAALTQPPGAATAAAPTTLPRQKRAARAQPVANSKPAKTKPRKAANAIAVPMVVGALGRGNEELAAAMRKAVARAGVPVVKKQRKGAITIAGEVKLEPPTGSRQTVKLSWRVIDRDGALIGTITQNNQVPAGSLDAGWGRTAGLAAQAAAGGIFELLDRAQ